MTAVHVTVWGRAAADAPSVVLIHGTLTWGTACFERQLSLADRYRLLVVDRRGYGSSPDIAHTVTTPWTRPTSLSSLAKAPTW